MRWPAIDQAGRHRDATSSDEQAKPHLRQQAIDWMRADLAFRAKQLESNRAERDKAQDKLLYRQQASELASL